MFGGWKSGSVSQAVRQSVSQDRRACDCRTGIRTGLWYLEDESLVENGTEILALYFGLILFLFVWQQKDFDVGVRGPPHVHSSQVLSLEDPHDQLRDTEAFVTFTAVDARSLKCPLT